VTGCRAARNDGMVSPCVRLVVVIDHDCCLGDGVHIATGVSLGGGVVVGDCSCVGIGAAVCHSVEIAANVSVSVGAVLQLGILGYRK